MRAAIRSDQVRYIKLGQEGEWEKECLDRGIIRYGFGSANAERFPLCQARQWDKLAKSFIAEGKTKGTATRHTNETRLFFEDDGSTLWITFVGERLCWGSSNPPHLSAMPTGTAFGELLRMAGDGPTCMESN